MTMVTQIQIHKVHQVTWSASTRSVKSIPTHIHQFYIVKINSGGGDSMSIALNSWKESDIVIHTY